jgi:protein tyrosine phosphatase
MNKIAEKLYLGNL